MIRTSVKKIIFMTLIGMSVSIPAYAAWDKQDDKWAWIENEQKVIGWKLIDNKWYNFDENGYMNVGWIQDNNQWYLLNNDGAMCTSWKELDGYWYYFNESGVMQSGWINIDNKWYLFNEQGKMQTGWIEDNGTWYYADITGRLEKGDISIDGKIYSFAENGSLLDGLNIVKDESASVESYMKVGYVNTNSDLLNVRSSSNLNSSIITKLPRGSEVTIIGEISNGFYPIDFNGKTAWVSSDWISFEKPDIQQNNLDISNKDNVIMGEEEDSENKDTVTLGAIRTTAPDLNDIHYYSDSNIFYKVRLSPPFLNSLGNPIKGNCTWYAWGRIWELTGKQPVQANFIGNAYEWWTANIATGKYKYGLEPKVGALAVWNSSLPGSGGSGHVAVVEKIDNNKIYISESMWHGECFKYQEIYSTQYLYGYIYLDEPNY